MEYYIDNNGNFILTLNDVVIGSVLTQDLAYQICESFNLTVTRPLYIEALVEDVNKTVGNDGN